jgi:type I restriction enzyme S subunit
MAGELWHETTIGEQATLQRGIDITKAEQRPGKVPVISSGGISSYHDTVAVKGPGVVLGRKGVVGSVFYVEEDYWPHDTSLWVKDFHDNWPRFVYYFFKSVAPRIARMDVGSANPTLNRNHVHPMPIVWPPLAEQKAIAAVLGALDDKIELNRRMNATLEAMARALFQSWFVDFDPVRARLDGRQPTGLDEATAAIFPASFQESHLGEIPHGWRLGTLGELVQLRTDRVEATPAKDITRYIALEDMPTKSIDLSNFRLGSAVNSSITAFRKGDVLFGSMRPYFHKVGLAFFDGITRTTTFVLKPRKDCFRHFALLHFFSDDVVAHATTASVGTTIPYVRWDSMESYSIPIPPDALLVRFEKMISPLVERISIQGEESRTLATLRDTLLPKLLSGELVP